MNNESQSHITQSIHASQSNPHKITKHFTQRQQSFVPNQQQQPFIHYYEENIKLKRKQNQMTKEILQLKQKLTEQTKKNKTLNDRQLKLLAAGKKVAWDSRNSHKRPPSVGQQDGQKVGHLLEIIEHYKQKMITGQQENENLKRKIHLLEQDVRVKEKKSDQIMKTFQESSSYNQGSAAISDQLKSTVKQLELEKQRNKYNEAQIKRLQTKLRSIKLKEDEFDQLKIENRNIEEKLLRLTQLPSFGNVVDRLDEEHKVKQIQSKYKLLNEKYTHAKNQNIKIQADLKLLQNKLIEVSHEADSLQKQNASLKQKSISNPTLERLSNDPDLLSRVVYKIEEDRRPQMKSKLERQSYEQIVMEKEELANQIISLRAKMEALQDTWKEKERLAKIQKQQMMTMLQKQNVQGKGEGKATSKSGVPYSDDVGMFSEDSSRLASNTNSFDLFLGELYLLQSMLRSSSQVQNTENLLIIAIVDFYNHDTVNTISQARGCSSNLKAQFSFAVTEDEFFFRYLNKGSFNIDIWATEGNNKHHIGKANIDLKSLIIKSKHRIAPVSSASAPIYLDQKVMGSINFVMRMRLPIHDQVQKITEIGQMIGGQTGAEKRRLIIHIEEGKGFHELANTFVYYPFRLEDYYTKTYKGANPVWNHYKSIDLMYNDDVKNYLRKNELELVVLDDNTLLSGGQSDVVGNGYLSLIPLLENKTIKERVQIMKGTQKIAFVDVRIFWHNTGLTDRKQKGGGASEIPQLHERINEYIKVNRYDVEDIFRLIDKNRTGMVSFNEFHVWAIKVCPNTNVDVISQYYSKFKQPVNLINFANMINEKMEEVSDLAKEMSAINEFMHKNTTQIKKKQTLQEYLKGKDLVDISLEIDRSQNGKISREELQEYFDAHNIEASIQDKEINIGDFLKKYKNLT